MYKGAEGIEIVLDKNPKDSRVQEGKSIIVGGADEVERRKAERGAG